MSPACQLVMDKHTFCSQYKVFINFALNNNSAVCSTDWEMRLVNGGSSLEGRLEICLNGVWGTICDQSWDDRDAGVACSQMGYSARGISVLQIN